MGCLPRWNIYSSKMLLFVILEFQMRERRERVPYNPIPSLQSFANVHHVRLLAAYMFIYLCVVRCLFAAVQRSYVFLAVCFVRHPLSSLNVALVFTTTTVATHNRSHRQIVFRFYCNCHDFYLILKFAELNWTVGRIIKGAFPQSLSFFFFVLHLS